MKLSAIVIVGIGLFVVPHNLIAAGKCGALQHRVWQLQDYNMEHIKRVIELAAKSNINRIQLSHHIVMDSEQILESPQLAADINKICTWAHEKGIKVDVWTHELNGVPADLRKDGKANLDDPKLWEWLKEKYVKVFKLCPDMDGLVLTLQETDMSIYHENKVLSSIPPEQRVARLVDELASVCKSQNKELFVRTFSYEPQELKYISDGLKTSKSDIIVMLKCQPMDWQPFYPDNPAIGNVGNHPQIVEFDLGHEFTGRSRTPYIDLDYLERRLNYALDKNIAGAVLRIERHQFHSLDTPNWGSVVVFSAKLNNPCLDQKKSFREWIENRYGKEAAPYLEKAFSRTFDTVNKTYFVLGEWITNHSMLPDYAYATRSLMNRSISKWDPSGKSAQQELLSPNEAVIMKIDAEKSDAINLALASIRDISAAKKYLKDEDYKELASLFERQFAAALVWKAHFDLYFNIRRYEKDPKEEMAKQIEGIISSLQGLKTQYHKQLVELASEYKNPANQANIRAIDSMIAKARETIALGKPKE